MKQRFRAALFILAAACMLFRPQLITAAAGLRVPQEAVSANSKANLTITSIDVGKGDCILVETHDGTVMIDTGYENTSDRVLSWLTEHEIEKIDVLIISHYDKDHVGGAADVIRHVPIGQVYLPDYTGTSKKYKNMMAALEETKVPYSQVSTESSFRLGNAAWRLYPSGIAYDGNNDNDCSLAATVRCRKNSALFAGDLEKDGIKYFVSEYSTLRPVDILKLPHHGVDEDNTDDLIALADPKIAFVTDAQERRISGKILDLLAERSADVFSCVEYGTIVLTGAEDGTYTIEAERPNRPGVPDKSGEWRYELSEDKTASITEYLGSETTLSIPAKLDGYPVTGIGDSAFFNRRELTGVSIPEGVTDIGISAFAWCTGLEEVSLPNGLESMGEAAFACCTSLEKIDIPDSIHSIGYAVFTGCGLKEATIPAGVESLGDSSFSHCKELETIHFKGTKDQWEMIEKDKSWNKKSNAAVKIDYGSP